MENLRKKFNLIFDREDKYTLYRVLPIMIFGLILEVIGIGLIPVLVKLVRHEGELNSIISGIDINLSQEKNIILLLGSGFIFIFLIIRGILVFKISKKVNLFVFKLQEKISLKILNGYLNLDWDTFRKNDPQIAIKNISTEVQQFVINFISPIVQIIVEMIFIISIILTIVYIYGTISSILFILLGFGALLISRIMKPLIAKIGNKRYCSEEASQLALKNIFYGIREIYVYEDLEKILVSRFKEENKNYTESMGNLFTYIQLPRLSLDIFLGLFSFGIILFGFIINIDLYEIISILIVFMIGGMRILPGLNKIINGIQNINYSAETRKTVFNLLEKINIKFVSLDIAINSKINSIELNELNIGFTNKLLKNDLNINLKRNDFLVISGASGVGKSTLADTLMGFISPLRGKILINNIDLQLINKRDYIKRISYVSQNNYIFNDTLAFNVVLRGKFEEYTTQELSRIKNILSLVGLFGDETLDMSQKLGNGGVLLSGGQLRRLALARALWKNSDILILDEITSGLDLDSEIMIVELLKNIPNKIILAITHSKYFISQFDNRIFLV